MKKGCNDGNVNEMNDIIQLMLKLMEIAIVLGHYF